MTKAFRDKIIAKAEELGWNCTASDENEWEFYQMSPAGEDFGVCLYDEDDIVSAVRKYADDFDGDEHVEELIEAKRNGFRGVPSVSILYMMLRPFKKCWTSWPMRWSSWKMTKARMRTMRFSAAEWKEFLEIGSRESSFDWDIPCGYITFGTCGMSIAKIIKKKWMRKFVNDWRNKTYKQVNDEIRQQEWEAM